jgi:hypothetical protein
MSHFSNKSHFLIVWITRTLTVASGWTRLTNDVTLTRDWRDNDNGRIPIITASFQLYRYHWDDTGIVPLRPGQMEWCREKRDETAAAAIRFSVANHRSDSHFRGMKDQNLFKTVSQYLAAHFIPLPHSAFQWGTPLGSTGHSLCYSQIPLQYTGRHSFEWK